MKKILVISGSHRKKGTGIDLLDTFKTNFSTLGYAFETVHLSYNRIEYCRGCTVCFKVGETACPCKDDVQMIVEKMKVADGVVFISPVYGLNISGQLKTFLDRITYLYHRPSLIGKPAVFFASTDLGGATLTGKYMTYILNTMGMRTVGTLGAYAIPYKKNVSYQLKISNKLKKAAQKFADELKVEGMPEPKFNELFHFTKWQAKNRYSKSVYPADYDYWLKNGWFDSDYFYPAKVKMVDKARLRFISNRVSKMVQKRL
ncbi:MAG: flavodoxin family protein [Clostridiales bacterium]|nr:flavodoxin family protein [Clostridiales bacterium]